MKKTSMLKAFLVTIPKFTRVSPALFIIFNLVCVIHAVARAFLVPATQLFLDRAADFAARKTNARDVLSGLVILASAHVCRQLAHGVHHVLMMMHYRIAEGKYALAMHKKIGGLPPAVFEDTRALDDINKAIKGKDETVWFTGGMLTIFNFYIPYFAFMAVYFSNIKPVLIFLLALAFAPAMISHVLRTRVFAQAEDKAAPVRREFEYYELCMTGREYFKETRILGAFPFFRDLYKSALSALNKLVYRASAKAALMDLCISLLSLSGYAGVLFLLFRLLMDGEIGAGAFAAIFSSMDMVFSLMREMIVDNLGESAKTLSRVQNYIRFMQMPEREGADTELPADAGIALRGVSYAYPEASRHDGAAQNSADEEAQENGETRHEGAARKAVDGVSVTIRSGETVAIVGENGSGKTTLVRLLTGLYLPDEGEVLYGETDVKTASAASIYKNISAVFQKYQRYQMTLRENIGIGDTGAAASDYILDKAGILAGIDKTDASFADGYDTMLSREFDGVDLSGGQWQRVAIARSLFRDRRIIVLDEPTAAIDPLEETKIYNRFAEISKGKTAIIVTHRLGSAKLADRILVMKQGKLVEQGAHDELLKAGGEYARLYYSQEQWYN